MSPLRSGNDFSLRSYIYEASDTSHVGEIRRSAAHLTSLMNFSEERATRVSIIINELGSNLARHAIKGRIVLQAADSNGMKALQIFSIDAGPGILNLSHAMTDGVTSSSTPGTGLGAIRRQADEFDVHSDSSGTLLFASVDAHDPTDATTVKKQPRFVTAAICSPIEGESVSGDSFFAKCNGDITLMMVADGLGHGPNAHKASATAIHAFRDMDSALPLEVILKRLHELLRSTRGAAISVVRVNPLALKVESLGVGNVRMVMSEGMKDRTLISHSGTVGLQFRTAAAGSLSWNGQGYLILHSDGLQSRWTLPSLDLPPRLHPALVAAKLFRDQNRGTDDTTVMVGGFIQ